MKPLLSKVRKDKGKRVRHGSKKSTKTVAAAINRGVVHWAAGTPRGGGHAHGCGKANLGQSQSWLRTKLGPKD